jgi:hypothetical protein
MPAFELGSTDQTLLALSLGQGIIIAVQEETAQRKRPKPVATRDIIISG